MTPCGRDGEAGCTILAAHESVAIENMRVEYGSFTDRAVRAQYIAARFGSLLKGKVLDVGCDRAALRKLLPQADYLGVDVGGEPDISINLERVDRLPFEDGTFDGVVCADVLEHLENLHHTFDELVRVSRGHLIISLPNNWANARRPISRGKGSIGHYGLSEDPPVDRHKWFFSLSEAVAFIQGRARRKPVVIRELFAMEKPRLGVLRQWRRLMHFSQMQYLNRYAHTLWVVLQREPPDETRKG